MDFAKKTARFRRSKNTKAFVLSLLLLAAGAGAMGGMGFYLYRVIRAPVGGLLVSTVSQIKTWAQDRKNNLQQGGATVVKRAAVNDTTEEPQIHFEFYTALPGMQMSAPARETLVTNADELEKDLSDQLKLSKKPKKETIHDL